MGQLSSADVKSIFWGGYSIRPYLLNLQIAMGGLTEENHRLGDDHVLFGAIGITNGTMQVTGMFNDNATASLRTAIEAVMAAQSACLVAFGSAVGKLAVGMSGNTVAALNTDLPKGEFVKQSAQAQSTGIVDPHMFLLTPEEVITADEVGANWNDPGVVGSADGGVAHFHADETNLDGGVGLKFEILEGDGTTMVLIPGLTHTFTGARGSIRVEVEGETVGEFVRCNVSFTGTPGPGKTARVLAAWVRR